MTPRGDAHFYDPRVATRILRGASMTAFKYIDLLPATADWTAQMEARLQDFDPALSPTASIIALRVSYLVSLSSLSSVTHHYTEFFKANVLQLRNTLLVNMLGCCATSLPCQTTRELLAGLMLWKSALHDDEALEAELQVKRLPNQSLLN